MREGFSNPTPSILVISCLFSLKVIALRGLMHPFLHSSAGQATLTQAAVCVFPLPLLGVFEAKGQDTLTFLQGQLTNDIVAPGIGQSRLAGYCTAQGRLLSTMVLGQAPSPDEVPLVRGLMRQDILASVLKRLSMFVLRSKVVIKQAEVEVVGVEASNAEMPSLSDALGHPLPQNAWETFHTLTGTWIAVPDRMHASTDAARPSRWWWLAGAEHQVACDKLALNWKQGSTAQWEAQDIQSGFPWIELLTQDLFIPQTLNLELIEGVSFTKGCYPGQEIVARSHYRGTVKKRMALGKVTANADLRLLPGSDIFEASERDQACGRLINVATVGTGTDTTHWVLFETTFDAYDRHQLRASAHDGPVIETVALPYQTRESTSGS
jgi:folate-binding protein YgfZ